MRFFAVVILAMLCCAVSFAVPAAPRLKYGAEMICIPAGSFLMGNSGVGDDKVDGQSEEFPQRKVTLPSYWIGKHEVTRGEYRKFIDAGGYADSRWWSKDGWRWKESVKRTQPDYWAADQNFATGTFTQTDDHPVVGVSYYEAEAYCRWAGGHLPTQAQWEKAARWNGKSSNVYPWGNTWDVEKCNTYMDKNPAGGYGTYRTTPVGSYPDGASPYGCMDMAGNVREWCSDWYKSYPKSKTYFDYTGRDYVLRGGSWYYNAGDGKDKGDTIFSCRSASRGSNRLPYGTSYDYGFRIAAGAPGAGTDTGRAKGRAMSREEKPVGRVIYNLDCSEYFVGTFGGVVPETIDKFVDDHAAAGVTDLFINVNSQKTNYRSDVWESYWDGYDPNLPDNQPFFEGLDLVNRPWDTTFYINTYVIHKMGCDYPQRMIDRSRHNGISPWISMRMNDAHEPGNPKHPLHAMLWRQHPEWWLSNGGYDYEQQVVRDYHMKLIKEICSRYDVDGIEMDFERFWLYFRPGREHEGAKLMDAFVKEARAATNAAAKRLNHPVQLAVRVPTTPWIARRHGLDAVAWAKAGYVDLIIASPFWMSMCSDIPVETWKGQLLGTNVKVAISQEDGINSGGSGRRTGTSEEVRGIMLSGLQRGADAAYFFNLFTGPYHEWPKDVYFGLLKDSGSQDALRAAPRRHAVTITHPWSEGEPGSDRYLPYTGTAGVFRIHIGPKPRNGQKASVEIEAAGTSERPDVTVNDATCTWSGAEGSRQLYDIPASALNDGYNLVKVNSKQSATLNWVEIAVR